jgi:dynamin 1-like protein
MFAKNAWKLGSRPHLKNARDIVRGAGFNLPSLNCRGLGIDAIVLTASCRLQSGYPPRTLFTTAAQGIPTYRLILLSSRGDTMASLGEDLLGVVNKLQDLVFNTIGNDSLDLPQIVRLMSLPQRKRNHLTLL